ncbi:N-6 DNA methylase [Vulgatibacter incomptus]|uniref:Modification methylase XamI n=1 Tax=Vulgatibacter incomptus TaxID=1391653 RepID=A0A0K1PGU5_9BACT|nr:N-6 DNA methylase [Vulgatibacter incomptus]AKU92651.1 Modification methylase XamI [Vulgatibacter incomptus]
MMARNLAISANSEQFQDGGPLGETEEAGLLQINGLSVPQRRFLGAYYTPDDVAVCIAQWAIADANGNILDPSFGGCAFMQAAASILKGMGRRQPGRNVFGVDIDETCARFVHDCSDLVEANVVFKDFLAVQPAELPGAPFHAIVGNPPYVRHHWLKDERRALARRIAEESGHRLPETASLWAYFVLHALAFLEPSGRLGMLVPEAILQADYAMAVRAALEQRFERVRLIHLRQRLFDGTDEPVVLIAAEGFGCRGSLQVLSVDTADELSAVLKGNAPLPRGTTLPNGRRIAAEALRVMGTIESSRQTVRFGELATPQIGIVTGANSHFIRSEEELVDIGIPASARVPILSRTRWLAGLEFTPEDHEAAAESGARAFLVRPTAAMEPAPGVQRWIEDGLKAGVDKRYKCSKREPWYRVDLSERPDAFVTSTRLGPPLLVLNRGTFRCTNALYAARWNAACDVPPEVVTIGFATTFVALWSELNGRRYGGGVLKLDLTALCKLPVPIALDAIRAFQHVDEALRCGDEPAARAIADDLVLRRGIGVSRAKIDLMRNSLTELTRQRIPKGEEL